MGFFIIIRFLGHPFNVNHLEFRHLNKMKWNVHHLENSKWKIFKSYKIGNFSPDFWREKKEKKIIVFWWPKCTRENERSFTMKSLFMFLFSPQPINKNENQFIRKKAYVLAIWQKWNGKKTFWKPKTKRKLKDSFFSTKINQL